MIMMKSSITSVGFAVLCSLLSLDTASAFMGMSFGNLLFAMNLCHIPGPNCRANCHGPLAPSKFCDNQCVTNSNRLLEDSSSSSSSGTTIMWTQAACDGIKTNSIYYESCIKGAAADCEETLDSEYTYTEFTDSSFNGGSNSASGGVPDATKLSFLPYVIAASVATMFLMMYAWKKRKDDEQLKREDLLAEEGTLNGAVARRFDRATIPSPSPAAVVEESHGVEYALA